MKHIVKNLGMFTYLLINLSGCFYDYSNWYKVELPTNTNAKSSIKIPNEWEIINKDEIIYLQDKESKEVKAEQIYCGYPVKLTEDNDVVYCFECLSFNPNIQLQININDYYSVIYNEFGLPTIDLFDDGENQRYCLVLYLDYHEVKGAYIFAMMFSEDVPLVTIKQILHTCW